MQVYIHYGARHIFHFVGNVFRQLLCIKHADRVAVVVFADVDNAALCVGILQ